MKSRDIDALDSVAVQLAATKLAQIAPGDKPEALLQALDPCLHVAAGLLMVVKPGVTTSITHHALRIPMPLVEDWMHTQPDYLAKSLVPAFQSNAGDFWSQNEGLSEHVRSGMEVLHHLDKFGLGEGAGLKLLRQPLAGGAEEHVLMALLTHRGERFPRQTAEICRGLAMHLQEAVVRLSLPFTVGRSIHAQLHEEDAIGFVCLGANNEVIELNQRAYELAAKYRYVARMNPGRLFMEDFVNQALKATKGGIWRLTHPTQTAMMQVRMSVMPKERFHLSKDLPIIKMEEWSLPPLQVAILDCLTDREREIVMILVRTGLSNMEIAVELKLHPDTVRTHSQNIHRKLNVRSRAELVALVNARELIGERAGAWGHKR